MTGKRPKTGRKSAMSRHQKVLITIAVGFLLYSLLGFMVLPAVLKNLLEKNLSRTLNREVTIENIQVNPYLLQIAVNHFLVQGRNQDDFLVSFEQLFVDLEAVSILKKGLIIKSIALNGPAANITRFADRTYNFSDIAGGSDRKEKEAGKPFLFSLNNIEILNGAVTFVDEPKETTHQVRSLNISIPFLSNVAHELETYVRPSLSALVDNTLINLSGRTIPFHDTRSTVFDIRAGKINIPSYLTYLPPTGDLTMKSGFLDITATLGFEILPDKRPAVTLEGDFTLKEIDLGGPGDESYLRIPGAEIKLAASRPLELDYHISSIVLTDPGVLIRRNGDGDILPLSLLPENSEPSPEPGSADQGPAFTLLVDEIALENGRLEFEDQSITEPFQTTLNPVDIKITGLSTRADTGATYNLSARTEARESIAMNGTLSLNPVTVDLQIDLQDMQVPRFRPYYSEFVTIQVTDGSLDLASAFHYGKTGDARSLRADNLAATLTSLAVIDQDDKKLLAVPALSIKEASWEPSESKITIGELSSSRGELHLVRREEGLVILRELLRPRTSSRVKTDSPAAENTSPWELSLKQGILDQFSLTLQDQVPAEPTTVLLDNIRLAVENISTAAESSGHADLDFRIDKKGTLAIKGPITVEPLSASLAVTLADLPVKTVQPYFSDKINLVVRDGSASFDGQLDFSRIDNREISTIVEGSAAIKDFVSLDPAAGEDFLKWKNLELAGLKYDTSRFSLLVQEVSWQDFYHKIVVFDTGVLNLDTIIQGSEPPADTSTREERSAVAKEKEPLLLKIDAVKLANGRVEFLDRNITPSYSGSLSELSGTITGLSSRADAMAEVNISGRLDEHAPLRITGSINPLRDKFFADLSLDFSNIELSPTSPYTGKYIGYRIAKGKLSLDLEYLVEDTTITGRNKAVLDQFTLGETVESPDAVKLPLKLAIALLKNRQGEITLNVPVQGDLADPEFSIGGVVFKAIFNLIAKAATSPFALLGAFLPQGEDLKYVDFPPGTIEITPEYRERLEAIAKALYERPGLEMDIKGGVAPQQERPVLHEQKFERLLKREKLKDLSRQKETVPSPEEIAISPEEYETYLEKAYKEGDFEKPENFLGLPKKLPPQEMEKLLRDHIAITDEDLRLLALERANAVKSFLVEAGPVEPKRLFTVEPAIEAGDAARVEMIIK